MNSGEPSLLSRLLRILRHPTLLLTRVPRKIAARTRVKVRTATILLQKYLAGGAKRHSGHSSFDDTPIVVSLKVDTLQRLEIFRTVCSQLDKHLAGTNHELYVCDASEDPFNLRLLEMTAHLQTPTRYRHASKSLADGYLMSLQDISQSYFVMHFDDMLATNLSGPYIEAACKLLELHSPWLNVVAIPGPVHTEIDSDSGLLRVTPYSVSPSGKEYVFQRKRPMKTLRLDVIDGYTFATFENFLYGFYFNNLVARRKPFIKKLKWYIERLDTVSAHQIEMATSDRAFGPGWTHVAVCLDDVFTLDLDFTHTAASVRPESNRSKELYDAVAKGYEVIFN